MIPNTYFKISAILTIFVLLAGGTVNSFHPAMAQTPDNNASGTAGTNNQTGGNSTDDKGADRHSLVQHMDDKLAAMKNMTEKIREDVNATHNMTAQIKEKLIGIKNMSEKIDDRLAALHNQTASLQQNQAFDSAVKKATQSYNDAIKQAYAQANTALKQARNNMTDSIKQVQEAVLQAKKASDNTTSTQDNNSTKYKQANTVYKEALAQFNQDYRSAITSAINAAKSNVTLIQQGLRSEGNTNHGSVSISSRVSADKSYFDIKAAEIKALAGAAFTLRDNSVQAMVTGFASVAGDNPTLDSAGQTYTNNINNIMQTFNAAVDAADSAAKSAIDAAAPSQ